MRGGRGGSRDNFRGGNRGNKFQGNGGRGNDRSRYDDGNGIQTVECGLYDGFSSSTHATNRCHSQVHSSMTVRKTKSGQ